MAGSTTMAIKTARRVVAKSFDGGAAMNALLLKRLHAKDFHRELKIVEGLLMFGMPQVDVQRITGLPQKMIANTARKTAEWLPKAGRRPAGMGRVFALPAMHLRMSIFLGYIDKLVPGLRTKGQIVTAEQLLVALRETVRACGPMSDRDVGVRYYLTAIHKMAEGELFLKQCGGCPVQYVKTRDPVRINGSVLTGGDCPYCQYLRGLKSKPNKQRTVQSELSFNAAREPALSVDPQQQPVADFDTATMSREPTETQQKVAFAILMQ